MLESRHVIGLFLLMLLFSGVFFTLGYVMGRGEYSSQASTSAVSRSAFDAIFPKTSPAPKRADKTPVSAAQPAAPAAPNSDWEFYNAGKPKTTEDHLKPASSVKTVPAVAKSDLPPKPVSASAKGPVASKSPNAASASSGSYTLQVAALTREADALDLASRLQKKKFPVFVLSPQADKYYRVQVGPYSDQKSADAAKKGLEAAGFKAIVKH